MKKLLFILNPNAGSHSTAELEAALAHAAADPDVPPFHAESLVCEDTAGLRMQLRWRLLAGDIDTVCVVGGDGSIMEVLPVLIDFPEVMLGIVPAGTGNLLAVNLNIPLATGDALAVVLSGRGKPLDIGSIGGHFFALLAGVGVVADIMENTSSTHKRLLGWWAYLLDGVRNIMRGCHATFKLTVDGQIIRGRGVSVVISNAASIMKPCPALTPDASPHDGMLDVCFLKARSKRDYIPTLYEVLTRQGEERPEHVMYFQTRRLRIESTPRLKVQADGNLIGHTPVDVAILPGKIRVMVPASPSNQPGGSHPGTSESFLGLLRASLR